MKLVIISSLYKTWVHVFYFYYSLLLVICRAMAVLRYAAVITVTAKKPLDILRKIPTSQWRRWPREEEDRAAVSLTTGTTIMTTATTTTTTTVSGELQRLRDLVAGNTIALSGCQFFFLTKTLFLTVSVGDDNLDKHLLVLFVTSIACDGYGNSLRALWLPTSSSCWIW